MDTTSSINDRKWRLVEIHLDAMRTVPLVEKPTIDWHLVVAMDSQAAKDYEKRGIEPFYSDYQQFEAGLPVNYGVMKLSNLAEDFTFPDGTVGKAGALYMELTKLDTKTFIYTVMVEEI